jgi:hypothetical protein
VFSLSILKLTRQLSSSKSGHTSLLSALQIMSLSFDSASLLTSAHCPCGPSCISKTSPSLLMSAACPCGPPCLSFLWEAVERFHRQKLSFVWRVTVRLCVPKGSRLSNLSRLAHLQPELYLSAESLCHHLRGGHFLWLLLRSGGSSAFSIDGRRNGAWLAECHKLLIYIEVTVTYHAHTENADIGLKYLKVRAQSQSMFFK